jgi:hypothetical protein
MAEGAPTKGAAVGFLDFAEPTRAGAAVGFLDMIDDDEAAAFQQEKAEEEKWLKDGLNGLTKSAQLLDNLVSCMQPVKEAWPFYMHSLTVLFADADSSTTLIRFQIYSYW